MNLLRNALPILTYHSIDHSGSVLSVTPETFMSHMTVLAESGYRVVSLNEVVSGLQNHGSLPRKAAVLTFDDGFQNFYYEAYPILKKFGFSATVFLVSGWCGKNNFWPGQFKEIPSMNLLHWNEIREMAGNGIEFGSHTMNHQNLSQLSTEEAEREISQSQKTIQDLIGQEVKFFAYPYGKYTAKVKRIVRRLFAGACSVQMDFTTIASDPYSLPRIDMFYFSTNNLFRYLDTPGFAIYVKSRKWLRALKGH